MSTISNAIMKQLRKLNAESTLEPKIYTNGNLGSCQILKTRLPKQYVDLAMIAVNARDENLFDQLSCSVTFFNADNRDDSYDLRPEAGAIVDKLDTDKVGWEVALGMSREPSPYDVESIANCIIELWILMQLSVIVFHQSLILMLKANGSAVHSPPDEVP